MLGEALPNGGPTGSGLTAKAAHDLASKNTAWPDSKPVHPDLNDALLKFSTDSDGGRLPSVQSLGSILRTLKDVKIGGRMFVRAGVSHHSILWKVVVDASSIMSESHGRLIQISLKVSMLLVSCLNRMDAIQISLKVSTQGLQGHDPDQGQHGPDQVPVQAQDQGLESKPVRDWDVIRRQDPALYLDHIMIEAKAEAKAKAKPSPGATSTKTKDTSE